MDEQQYVPIYVNGHSSKANAGGAMTYLVPSGRAMLDSLWTRNIEHHVI
jgi:hypothetical protein